MRMLHQCSVSDIELDHKTAMSHKLQSAFTCSQLPTWNEDQGLVPKGPPMVSNGERQSMFMCCRLSQ